MQDTTHVVLAASIPSFLLGPLVSFVLPAIVGTITSIVYQNVKKAQDWINAQPAQTHTFIVGALSILFPLVAKLVPGTPTDFFGLDATAVQSIVMFGATQATHAVLQKKAA
jgi:hypothetical protein